MSDGQAARAAKTRQSLLRTASEILENDGLDAVTLRALGAAAGVSRGAAYRHFADKDDLLGAVATESMRQMREAMLDAADRTGAAGPDDRLVSMLAAYVEAAAARPQHYRLIFGTDLNLSERPDLAAEAEATYELLSAEVRAGQAADALPGPAADVSALLLSVTHGMADLIVTGHATPAKGFTDPEALLRLLLATIRPEMPSPP